MIHSDPGISIACTWKGMAVKLTVLLRSLDEI